MPLLSLIRRFAVSLPLYGLMPLSLMSAGATATGPAPLGGGGPATRRCGRCLRPLPGDVDADPVVIPEFWLCPACREALRRKIARAGISRGFSEPTSRPACAGQKPAPPPARRNHGPEPRVDGIRQLRQPHTRGLLPAMVAASRQPAGSAWTARSGANASSTPSLTVSATGCGAGPPNGNDAQC
jgi:hypothetical protein